MTEPPWKFPAEMPAPSPMFIGVDPGVNGAIAFYRHSIAVHDLSHYTGFSLCELIVREVQIGFAYGVVEHPQVVPHERATSIATFWERVGFVEGVLITLKIPILPVRPQDWRRAFGCRVKGKAQKDWSRQKALELFPRLDLGNRASQDRADAVLIACYARQLHERGTKEGGFGSAPFSLPGRTG